MPHEGKFVLGLEEPDYPPRIHETDHEHHDAFARIMFKTAGFILAGMVIVFIFGLMMEFPLSFIPAILIGFIVLRRQKAKRRAKTPTKVLGIPKDRRHTTTSGVTARRNPSNLRQSGFRKR